MLAKRDGFEYPGGKVWVVPLARTNLAVWEFSDGTPGKASDFVRERS
jgi:hypothetical protein